ncbi:MAG: helix-turn-helix transcriptional regulator [Deltaproteobacteria bacterium]|nr:helix-turn-helix transcriptional regulator [Deltaproteobacteria bacterium]
MKDVKKLFGTRMKELRKNIGLSQEQLAEKAEVSSKYISRIEMGQHFPSIDTLVKLANALNVELKDFFEFSPETRNPKELKKLIGNMLNDSDEDKLRLLAKLVRAVAR